MNVYRVLLGGMLGLGLACSSPEVGDSLWADYHYCVANKNEENFHALRGLETDLLCSDIAILYHEKTGANISKDFSYQVGK